MSKLSAEERQRISHWLEDNSISGHTLTRHHANQLSAACQIKMDKLLACGLLVHPKSFSKGQHAHERLADQGFVIDHAVLRGQESTLVKG